MNFTYFQITSSTATMYVLRNLKKYTWYEIRVQPFYLTVEGQESNTVRVRTLEDGKDGSLNYPFDNIRESNFNQLFWLPYRKF